MSILKDMNLKQYAKIDLKYIIELNLKAKTHFSTH